VVAIDSRRKGWLLRSSRARPAHGDRPRAGPPAHHRRGTSPSLTAASCHVPFRVSQGTTASDELRPRPTISRRDRERDVLELARRVRPRRRSTSAGASRRWEPLVGKGNESGPVIRSRRHGSAWSSPAVRCCHSAAAVSGDPVAVSRHTRRAGVGDVDDGDDRGSQVEINRNRLATRRASTADGSSIRTITGRRRTATGPCLQRYACRRPEGESAYGASGDLAWPAWVSKAMVCVGWWLG